MKHITLIILTALLPLISIADSPITSSTFYTEYLEYPMVAYAEQTQAMDDKIATYLIDDNVLPDVKAAVINAISWGSYDATNSEKLLAALKAKYKSEADIINIPGIRADELMCYGYMLAMDDYFDVFYAATVTQLAASKSDSFTIHMINALVTSQREMDTSWCAIWSQTRTVINNKSLKRDMKTKAIQLIVDYMILYKSYC